MQQYVHLSTRINCCSREMPQRALLSSSVMGGLWTLQDILYHSIDCILYISFSFLSSMHELIFITCFFSSPLFSSFLHLRTFIRSSRALLARTKISTDKLNARTAPPVFIVCMPLLRHYLAISALIVRQIRRLERSLSVP